MSSIDFTIEQRGFDINCIALAVRTVGTCFAMRFQPDSRAMIGIGLLSVSDNGEEYTFTADARVLREGEMPEQLLDWLEAQLSAQSIVSWDNWGSVPTRLIALADPARYPRIHTAAIDVAGRWRALPRSYTWHLRQTRANTLPCLCPKGCSVTDCQPALPSVFLPDPESTRHQLINEAIAGWRRWATDFGDFDDAAHPAQRAIRALACWDAAGRPADGIASPR